MVCDVVISSVSFALFKSCFMMKLSVESFTMGQPRGEIFSYKMASFELV